MYTTVHQCNAMSSCLHSNVCTRQYINAMQCPHVCIPMYVRDSTSMQCNVLMFAFQCMYATVHQCNAMSLCLHSNVCTRQYINAMQCPHVCILMYVRDHTSMQCNVLMFAFQCMCATVHTSMQCNVLNVLMFAFQCMYATIHQCNAMSSCLHSNVCTRPYINAMQCPHVCIPMYVRDSTSMQCNVLNVCIPMYVRDHTSMQCNVLMFAFQCMYATVHQCNAMSSMFAFQCMYATIHQCNAMSSCLHSNACTRQYINAMQCPNVCIPMYVRDHTSMQCNVLMFAFQCMYATIHQCNAMSSCLHSNVCTRQHRLNRCHPRSD